MVLWYNKNMANVNLKNKVMKLRKDGMTYGEIIKAIGKNIPKSTLSYWCDGILLSRFQKLRIKIASEKNIEKGRLIAHQVLKMRRKEYLNSMDLRISHLVKFMENKNVAKIVASALYLGEGAKHRNGSLMLGNSDPHIIKLFLRLLRNSYDINESKFRCTVQCRADQNTQELEKFWRQVTKIPKRQFYKTRIDPRTIGKPSRKLDYKGVCRIEYYSADLYIELKKIGELICKVN